MVFEHVGYTVVAPGAGPTAYVPTVGNTFTIRNFNQSPGVNAYLLTAWTRHKSAVGYTRFRSPKLCDQVQGIRWQASFSAAGIPALFDALNHDDPEVMYAQDLITVDGGGSAVAGETEVGGMLLGYDNLAGVNGQFITLDELERRRVHTLPITTVHVGGAGAAGYTAPVALNAGVGTFKANTFYALVGYTFTGTAAIQDVGSIVWQGVDTGNLPVGGPGLAFAQWRTRHWFIDLAKKLGPNRGAIPVINSANAGGTIAQFVNDELANTLTLTSIFVELA